jgi:thiamine kinase-like enzyme
MKINKVYYNHKFAQTDQKPKSGLESKIEKENATFETLLNEANKYSKQYGENARSNFMATFGSEFAGLNPGHRQDIEKILPGTPTAPYSNSGASSGSGYNNAKVQIREYEPYLKQINDSNNGNNLLYLAAISAFGFPTEKGKDVNYLYTESNKDKIINRLNQITSNHYIQTKFPNIPNQLSDAIQRLDTKIKGQSGSTSNSGTTTNPSGPVAEPSKIGQVPSPMPTTFNPEQENFTFEAKIILQQIEDAETIANSDEQKFKRQWPGILETLKRELDVAISQNKINIPEKSDIETKLENLDNKYFEIYYPGGFKRLGGGKVVPLTSEEAFRDLKNQINFNTNTKEVNKLADKFTKYFLKADRNTVTAEEKMKYLGQINSAIINRNLRDDVSDNMSKIVLTQFDIDG